MNTQQLRSTARVTLIAMTLGVTTALAVHTARAAEPLSLFGTPLKGASRDALRQVLSKAGLTPARVDNSYYCDEYNTNDVLKGANKLTVCYTEDNNIFASAEYTFPAFMDTDLVKRVIDTVSVKYGRPNSVNGDYSLGNVIARWNQPQGMEVRVTRGWPDTTTYLDLIDISNDRKMHAQMQAADQARLRQRAQTDSKAF